jgi:protein-S-isoprenylcysteine O-methyltransferase Ste14
MTGMPITPRTVALIVFAAGWLPVFLLRSERFGERRAVANENERRSMWNALAAVTVHVVLSQLALRSADVPPPTLRLVIGVLTFATGFAFWLLARRALVDYGHMLDPSAPPPTLVTTGPFAIVRHPLALGIVIMALGPALAAATALTWASFAVVVVAMARRCHEDEQQLYAIFGDAYERYAESTPQLIPFVW